MNISGVLSKSLAEKDGGSSGGDNLSEDGNNRFSSPETGLSLVVSRRHGCFSALRKSFIADFHCLAFGGEFIVGTDVHKLSLTLPISDRVQGCGLDCIVFDRFGDRFVQTGGSVKDRDGGLVGDICDKLRNGPMLRRGLVTSDKGGDDSGVGVFST